MGDTSIEWADKSWNVVTGCTKISPGCANCYSERMTKRLQAMGQEKYKDGFDKIVCHPEALDEPLRWKKPSRIFVCSMADLFHDDVPDSFLDEVFGIILASEVLTNHRRHTFLVLTKRPERMRSYLTSRTPSELLKAWAETSNWITVDNPGVCFDELVYSATCHDWDENGRNSNGSKYKPWGYPEQLWPLKNLWLGVTAENQEQADKRIPILLQILAAKRFVSVEPMLSGVDLSRLKDGSWYDSEGANYYDALCGASYWASGEHGLSGGPKLDWVICGSESGAKRRIASIEWIRNLRDQCVSANVPFMLKQMDIDGKTIKLPVMEGKTWAQFPQTIS